MSGAKRRTGYRKAITHAVMHDFPEPGEGQVIAQVLKSQGSNLLECQDEHGDVGLAMLPTKFRKLLWIKRGDYVIVTTSDSEYDTAAGTIGRVRYMIEFVLYPEQVKHLQSCGKWPEAFKAPLAPSVGGIAPAALKGPLAASANSGKGMKVQSVGGGASLLAARLAAAAAAAAATEEEEEEEGSDDDDDEATTDAGGAAASAGVGATAASATEGAGHGDDDEEDGEVDGEEEEEEEEEEEASAVWIRRSQNRTRDLPPSESDTE